MLYACKQIGTYIHTYVRTYIHTNIRAYVHTCILHSFIHACTHTYIHTHTRTHTRTHTHTHKHMQHTHTHTIHIALSGAPPSSAPFLTATPARTQLCRSPELVGGVVKALVHAVLERAPDTSVGLRAGGCEGGAKKPRRISRGQESDESPRLP